MAWLMNLLALLLAVSPNPGRDHPQPQGLEGEGFRLIETERQSHNQEENLTFAR